MHKILMIWIMVLLYASAACAAETRTIWLDELDMNNATAGWGQTRVNRSVDGNPLTINQVQYDRGVGTHATGRIIIKLDKKAVHFTALVGVDDEVTTAAGDPRGSVNFQVRGDKKLLWQSGVMHSKIPAKEIDLDISGIEQLLLIYHEAENNLYDHADWVMARIEYTDAVPRTVSPPRPEPYILTPQPGPEPRLTGPRIFGARPGHPFLHTLTATGDRPLTFAIEGLPGGLTLDPETGRITGKADQRGAYITTVTARNTKGADHREFKIVIGDTICLTPPMGWNSWNCWACSVDDEKVRASARAMVDSGLINHGWSYINIDDCWMRKPEAGNPDITGPVRDESGNLIPNARFPDMNALTDYIHNLGLKAGIYISPGPTTCQGFAGSWMYELRDARQFAAWGFDYLKYDWCGYSSVTENKTLEDKQRPYIIMRCMLDRVDRDIVYSLCQYGMGEVWTWGEQVGGNCWRTTGDINDSWSSMSRIGFGQAELYPFAGPGHWNDPDMLVVGKVGWGPNLHDTHLNAHEQYTHISLWCLLSAPLLIGCPIEQLDDFTLNLLTNDEVLEVNQDPLGQQARRYVNRDTAQIWAKDMADGSKAVGFFNLDEFDPQEITLDFSVLDLTGSRTVRDLWRQKDLGRFTGSFTTTVPPHGVTLVRLIHDH